MSSTSKRLLTTLIAALALPLASQQAVAGSKVAYIDVTMRIVADCTISVGGMDFGQNQGVLAATVSASSTINLTCTNTTPYNVGLDSGNGTGSSNTTRYLSGTGTNAGTVRYNLFRSQGSGVWGNTQGTDTMSGVGSGSPQTMTVYGEIASQTTPAPDTYKSTVTATVYF